MSADHEQVLKHAAAALEAAHASRDQAVLEAHASGMGGTKIAAAVNLSRMQVHRIIKSSEISTAQPEGTDGA